MAIEKMPDLPAKNPLYELIADDTPELAIAKLADKYRGLKATDKQSYEVLKMALRDVVSRRTGIEKRRLSLKRDVDKHAAELTRMIEDIEAPLVLEKDKYEAEAKRIAAEKAAIEKARVDKIHARIDNFTKPLLSMQGKTAAQLLDELRFLQDCILNDKFDYEELTQQAKDIQQDVIHKITAAYTTKKAAEDEAARIAAEKAALAAEREALEKEKAALAEAKQQQVSKIPSTPALEPLNVVQATEAIVLQNKEAAASVHLVTQEVLDSAQVGLVVKNTEGIELLNVSEGTLTGSLSVNNQHGAELLNIKDGAVVSIGEIPEPIKPHDTGYFSAPEYKIMLNVCEAIANEKATVSENMQRWGGGFVKALGAALSHADMNNTQRIKKAFPEYWDQYLNWHDSN